FFPARFCRMWIAARVPRLEAAGSVAWTFRWRDSGHVRGSSRRSDLDNLRCGNESLYSGRIGELNAAAPDDALQEDVEPVETCLFGPGRCRIQTLQNGRDRDDLRRDVAAG